MRNSCPDSKMQTLLHAYELGMISDEDKDVFETHLLECPSCFEQLKEFAPRGIMLSASPEIRRLLAEVLREDDGSRSTWQKLRRILSPHGVPLVFKPVILMLVVLLMLYPCYLGLRSLQPAEVSVVQEIALMQTRSPETFSIDPDQNVVLSFMCPDGGLGNVYSVVLLNGKGIVIYEDSQYSSADSYGVGRLLLPGDLISPGTYTLTVEANGAAPEENRVLEHVFHIKYSIATK